ncbi:MAG: hypothetical protein AAGA60_25450 [Cyanobacteria bacterium P01_E01_bin.42]
MLVILTDEQVISPQQVCCNCLLADSQGLPRWHQGKLGCGLAISTQRKYQSVEVDRGSDLNLRDRSREKLPDLYQCQMGFRVAEID